MKIVHIITRMILGGAQENTLLTCEALHARGHRVTLITGPSYGPEGKLLDRARRGGFEILEVECLRREINPFHDVPGYFRLKDILRKLDPDIVHTHSAKGGVLGRWAAYDLRRDSARGCCTLTEVMNQSRADLCGRPRIVHTIHGLSFHPYQASWKNALYIAVERAAGRRTDCFISVAEAMTKQSLRGGIGRAEQYVKIFSGLETEHFLRRPSPEEIAGIRKEYRIAADAVVIVTVARLAELKGHEYIIESAKELASRHPKVIWLFVGDGYLRKEVEQHIARAGLSERFRLTGLVPPERVGPILHASDILAHCSLREGLARALPQALLCGKPAISFDVDGAGEVVISNQTGFLIPPQDVAALTAAQKELIENEPLRRQMGEAGKQLCQQEFDSRVMADRIERVYRSFPGLSGGSHE